MKKIFIALSAVGLILFGSCSEGFLQKDSSLEIEESSIFSSPERIESSLLGIYAQLKNSAYYSFMGGKTYVVFDAMGDDFYNISGNTIVLRNTYDMSVKATDAENITTWQEAYLAINDANVFLVNLDSAKAVAGDMYDQYKAEALFTRGFAYYYLNMLYGKPYTVDSSALSVPLRLTANTDLTGNNLAQSTVKQIFEQILADVSPANIANLPDGSTTETGTGRATKAAAHMLRMRVYMAMNDWTDAIAEGTAINGYALVNNITTLFATPFMSSENIFSFPMADNNYPNTQESVYEYYYDGQIMILNDSIGFGVISKAGYNNPADARVSGLTSTSGTVSILTKVNSSTDWIPVYRYAETLLNLAECYISKTTPNLDSARICLKQVRRRSLVDSTDTNFSNAQIDILSAENLKTAIYNERRLEFLGESIRGLDIHRRGENYVKPDMDPVTPSDGGYIWPIPTTETSINKSIVQ
jgi:starch-binding outer membrane protein, SusD/RagB family